MLVRNKVLTVDRSPVDVGVLHVLDGDPAHHLHPHRAVDEEDQGDQEHDPGQRLKGSQVSLKCENVTILHPPGRTS